MEKLLFEQMGGTYTQVGDYLLPNVELPQEKPIGVWGTRHYHHTVYGRDSIKEKFKDGTEI